MRNVALIVTSLLCVALTGTALAETIWASEDTSVRRWHDNADVSSGTVETGARLEVVYREEGWIRVRLPGHNAGFGWIAEAKVTTQSPETDIGGGEFELPGGLELPGGRSLPPLNLDLQ